MTRHRCVLLLLWSVLLGVGSPTVLAAQGVNGTHAIRCGDSTYRYVLYVPHHDVPAPVLVLLHGAGDIPESMVDAWQRLAGRDGIILLAPELPRVAAFEAVAPAVFRCMVEDVKQRALVDPRRVYLFGHSMGGYLGYDAALLESRYFAAAAIHAMGIAPDYTWIIGRASRKIPIAIYIGDRDQLIPLAGVERTRDLLVADSFPVHYVELAGHDHDYYAKSGWINADAWKFLGAYALPSQ
ncbi:MAG: alpha/beta fold hydrolase [Gemmatimonadales bacterium]